MAANLQQLIQLAVAGKLDQKQFEQLPAEIRQALAQRLVGGGQPPQIELPSELKDISHLFGAGTVGQQVKRANKTIASGFLVAILWTIVILVIGAIGFFGIGILCVLTQSH